MQPILEVDQKRFDQLEKETGITREQIYNSIKNAPSWNYLDELKDYVAKDLGLENRSHYSSFGMCVYTENNLVRAELNDKRIADMGFVEISSDNYKNFLNKKVECLIGQGIMGDTIKEGKIKELPNNSDADYMFLPKGCSKNGYSPRYVRLI